MLVLVLVCPWEWTLFMIRIGDKDLRVMSFSRRVVMFRLSCASVSFCHNGLDCRRNA